MNQLTKIPSYVWLPSTLANLIPMIFMSCHFLTIMPYYHFPIIIPLSCLHVLLFHRTFPCRIPSLCHASSFFLSSYHGLCHNSFLFFSSSSPYLGRILSEFFFPFPRPNINQEIHVLLKEVYS